MCRTDICCILFTCFFFFFKQKTAYELRISDWSSDVCSSDLLFLRRCFLGRSLLRHRPVGGGFGGRLLRGGLVLSLHGRGFLRRRLLGFGLLLDRKSVV